MTVVIELKPEIEEKIKTQAFDDGLKFEDYLKSLIEETAEQRERMKKLSKKSIEEVYTPVQKEFEESGMSEDELNVFLDDLRGKVWQEKQNS